MTAPRLAALFALAATNSVVMPLMGYSSLPELMTDTWIKWQDSTPPKYANWLRAKIGLMSGNKARTLVFSAKRDGVHGMIAGSTGSGKSELLISMITGILDPTAGTARDCRNNRSKAKIS